MDGEVDSMIYFTSDLHFYHKNVIKHANRPYSDEDEMNKELFWLLIFLRWLFIIIL